MEVFQIVFKITRFMLEYFLDYFQVESDYLEYFWWKEHYTVHTVLEAKDRAFCLLCEKLHSQQTWDGGYHFKPVTIENHCERTGGDDKYQDFVSWFKKDKCWQPSWLDSIGLDVGPDVRLDIRLDI